jgi:hypothetical protein
LCTWLFWAIGFRLSGSKPVFERARRAAFSTGYSLDRLRAGRDAPRLIPALNRLVFGMRTVILSVTPR